MSTTPSVPESPPPDFLSPTDLADAEEIIQAHLPMRVAVVNCTCGEVYPCRELRWAHLITRAAEAGG